MDKKNIIEKVQKLLKLQNSAEQINSLGEAAAVARKIRNLLMEYNLSMADIDMEKGNEKTMHVSEEWSGTDGNGSVWKYKLLSIIARNNLCHAYIRMNKKMFIVGEEVNVTIVKQFYDYLLNAFRRMARDRWNVYVKEVEKEYGMSIDSLDSKDYDKYRRMFMKSYFEGVPAGLNKNYESMKKTQEETALVLCHDKRIDEYVESHFEWSDKKTRNRRPTVYGKAYYAGISDAQNISLNKQINE